MVVVRVEERRSQLLDRFYLHPVRPLLDLGPNLRQLLRHDCDPVRLLESRVGGADDFDWLLGPQRQGGHHRKKVRRISKVEPPAHELTTVRLDDYGLVPLADLRSHTPYYL